MVVKFPSTVLDANIDDSDDSDDNDDNDDNDNDGQVPHTGEHLGATYGLRVRPEYQERGVHDGHDDV